MDKNERANSVYIFYEKDDWSTYKSVLGDPDPTQAFRMAKFQFDIHTESDVKGLGVSSKSLERTMLDLLKDVPKIDGEVENFISQLEDMTKGDNALHNKKIAGINMSLNQYAYGAKDNAQKFEKAMLKMLEDNKNGNGKDWKDLISGLKDIVNTIESAGGELRTLESGKWRIAPNIYVDPFATNDKIKKLYWRLREIVNKKTGLEPTVENARYMVSMLKGQGFSFANNLNGAFNETENLAITGAVLTAKKSFLKQALGLPKDAHLRVQVETVGDDTFESFSGIKSVRSKGDTKITLKWNCNGEKGSWSYLISEKSNKIPTQSRAGSKKANWRGRLVDGARYDVIFDNVGIGIQEFFCNMYLHERMALLNKQNPIMGYIGARCAANILAGPAGELMAHAVREGTGQPVPISEVLEQMGKEANRGNAGKYINCWMSKAPTVKHLNKKVYTGAGNEEDKWERSNNIYREIRNKVKFSATIGWRQGLDGII